MCMSVNSLKIPFACGHNQPIKQTGKSSKHLWVTQESLTIHMKLQQRKTVSLKEKCNFLKVKLSSLTPKLVIQKCQKHSKSASLWSVLVGQ